MYKKKTCVRNTKCSRHEIQFVAFAFWNAKPMNFVVFAVKTKKKLRVLTDERSWTYFLRALAGSGCASSIDSFNSSTCVGVEISWHVTWHVRRSTHAFTIYHLPFPRFLMKIRYEDSVIRRNTRCRVRSCFHRESIFICTHGAHVYTNIFPDMSQPPISFYLDLWSVFGKISRPFYVCTI